VVLSSLNASTVILVLVFAAVFMLGQTVFGLVRAGRVKQVVNRRLVTAEKGLTLGEMVVELRKQRGLTEDGDRRLKLAWLSDLVLLSGVIYRPRQWVMMAAIFGVIAAAGVFALSHKLVIAVPVGWIAAALGPLVFLKVKAGKRSRKLGEQLPEALEVVVRSLEAGHPVPTAIALVGREMPDPIGSEFGMAGDEIAYGATLEQAVGHIAERCRHPDVDLFAATIRLQERAGGNLVGLLKMNAHTVRQRHKMRLKIQAASSEGRLSAWILTAVPFVVVGLLTLISPHFYGDVIHERGFQIGAGTLCVWMFIGNLVIRKMIAMRI
jgi:tight adherence protein B